MHIVDRYFFWMGLLQIILMGLVVLMAAKLPGLKEKFYELIPPRAGWIFAVVFMLGGAEDMARGLGIPRNSPFEMARLIISLVLMIAAIPAFFKAKKQPPPQETQG
jgi:hypothetical protein